MVVCALPKVFIDGEAGTTGLQVRARLAGRGDLEVISPPDDLRKDPDTRRQFLRDADAAILCLPDAASEEAAAWADADGSGTVLIDASTAFRVDPGKFNPKSSKANSSSFVTSDNSDCAGFWTVRLIGNLNCS